MSQSGNFDYWAVQIGLSCRAYNAIKALEHEARRTLSIADVKAIPDARLLKLKNFGRTSLRELRKALDSVPRSQFLPEIPMAYEEA